MLISLCCFWLFKYIHTYVHLLLATFNIYKVVLAHLKWNWEGRGGRGVGVKRYIFVCIFMHIYRGCAAYTYTIRLEIAKMQHKGTVTRKKRYSHFRTCTESENSIELMSKKGNCLSACWITCETCIWTSGIGLLCQSAVPLQEKDNKKESLDLPVLRCDLGAEGVGA